MIKKILKVLLANFSIFLFGLLLIEIFFGYWFDENNLGPYMREHRLKNSPVTWYCSKFSLHDSCG